MSTIACAQESFDMAQTVTPSPILPHARPGEARPGHPRPGHPRPGNEIGLTRHIAARRGQTYTHFVALMKFLLPAVALGLLLLVAVWPRLQDGLDRLRVGFNRLDLGEAGDLRMVNAHYSGIDKLHRPYVVTADVARQTPNHNDLVALEGPKADMTLTNGAWLAVTSDTGVYMSQSQLLDLYGAVKLFHDRGYELTTDSAHVDMPQGAAEGHDPVQGQGVFGDITSQGFRLTDHGDNIVFTGKAKLHLVPRPVGAPP
jgi:lipopolysaccharide export system protein LptC